jgi:biopolymer transport protein ExbD
MPDAKKRTRRRRRGARLEMTSLMDVMFLVLVFFIYCIFDMAVHRGVKVNLPSAVGHDERGERIIVTILQDDSMQLNGVAMSADEVVDRIRELYRVKMDFPVLISGDRRSSLGVGIELLARLKGAGIGKVSFQVNGEPANPGGYGKEGAR